MVREIQAFTTTASRPAFGASFQAVVLPPGGMVASASSGTTITAHPGHGFEANQKLIVGTDTTRYRTVISVSGNNIEVGETVSVAVGEFLVNLGTDTGSTSPNYDGSGLAIYADSGYQEAYADQTLALDSEGRGRYWHKGVERWELILTSTRVPLLLYTDTGGFSQRLEVSDQATGGSGASDSPWTGWETEALQAVVNNMPIHFGAGYYSSTSFSVPVSNTNTPSGCVITGSGSACTFLTITSDTGQFRVYGNGSGTRVLDGVRIIGLTVYAGANNTSAGLVSFENFDIGSYVDDIRVDPTADFTVDVGIQVLNCENCHFGFLEVRGRVVTLATAGHVETGLNIYTDDGIQRGDIHFAEVHVTDITTGLSISSSGGSINNIFFGVFKAVNPSIVDGTLGVSLASNAEQITFGQIMLEALANGLSANAVEHVRVLNGLASQIHNEANSAGSAFTFTDCSGGNIFCRIDTVYDGIVLAGTTTRFNVQGGAAGTVSHTYFADSSSGENFYRLGQSVISPTVMAGRFTSTGGFSIGTRVAAGSIASGVLTLPASPTSNNLTVDTEAAAGSDDLDTLSGGFDGAIIVLSAANDARTVVVKNNTGNIKCGADRTLDNSLDVITLQRVGSNWVQLAFTDNAA